MSDRAEHASLNRAAMTSSPRSSMSRPHWPWSTYHHQSSTSPIPSPIPAPSAIHAGLSSLSLNSGPAVGQVYSDRTETYASSSYEDNMRHWNFTAFEWLVRDVSNMRSVVEREMGDSMSSSVPAQMHDSFEVLRESAMLGEGKFKLEISCAPPELHQKSTLAVSDAAAEPTDAPRHLTLYLTSLMLDYAHANYEIGASIMVAIKGQDDRVGDRGSKPEWIWQTWEDQFVFREHNEVYCCSLPLLSSLLESPTVAKSDSFVICVQIHSPLGPFYPQQPSAFFVPHNLLTGFEAMLDNPNTGDVRFICLERYNNTSESPANSENEVSHLTNISSESRDNSLGPSFSARKRVIYAHSDIIRHRSDYFMTMLGSSFTEATYVGERRIYTITVEETDYVTLYWILKWMYANWLRFDQDADPRFAVDGFAVGWTAQRASHIRDWGWKLIDHQGAVLDDPSTAREDARSVTSAESRGSSAALRGVTGQMSAKLGSNTAPSGHRVASSGTVSPTATKKAALGPTGISNASSSTSRRQSSAGNAPPSRSSSIQMIAPISPSATYPGSSSYPSSPRQGRTPQADHVTGDPHSHPTTPPLAAPALSVYATSHRYGLTGLTSLALEHLMTTVTPESSFALLLASSTWPELHSLVEDYVIGHWEEVSVSANFESCCQDVANGEWGKEGGKTLAALFRRLRSPSVKPSG